MKCARGARMEQDGEQIDKVSKDKGLVTVTAQSKRSSMDNSSKYIWSAMNPDINDVDGDYFNASFVFDPSNLSSGSQTINVLLASPQDSLSESQQFEIISDSNAEKESIPTQVYLSIAIRNHFRQ
jgi:hypothetical protein